MLSPYLPKLFFTKQDLFLTSQLKIYLIVALPISCPLCLSFIAVEMHAFASVMLITFSCPFALIANSVHLERKKDIFFYPYKDKIQ